MRILVAAIVIGAAGLAAAEPAGFARVDSFQFEGDCSWVKRELAKAPAFKSEKVRWNIWLVGEGRQHVMIMAWDESGGTGSGYDTLYVDKNFNGDLTEEGEHFFHENFDEKKDAKRAKEHYPIGEVKDTESGIAAVIEFRSVYKSDGIHYPSHIEIKHPKGGYSVGCIPGNLNLRWAEKLEEAPIYRLNGQAVPEANGKRPGQPLGVWEAGRTGKVGYLTKLYGADEQTYLLFAYSKAGSHPATVLRVLNEDGTTKEEVAFAGGCG